MVTQKIRIKLRSHDHNLIDKSAEKIVKSVKATGAVVSGPIPLPTNKKNLHSFKITARKQKGKRTVPIVLIQTPFRYSQFNC